MTKKGVPKSEHTKKHNREYMRQYSKDNPQDPKRNRRWKWLKRYGITPEEWDALFEKQGKRCAICGTNAAWRWDTDHCHSTKRVRGILCHMCNMGLGAFRDSQNALLEAARYLGRK